MPDDRSEVRRGAAATGEPLPPVVGVVGFKGSGKTTLLERLVAELVARGLVVRTIKHAHHELDLDTAGKDSWRHRAAGAGSVAVVSAGRWAILHELRGAEPPAVEDVVRALGPCDLVLVEGWKLARHPKIEVRAPGSAAPRLWETDGDVIAVASSDDEPGCPAPVLGRDAVGALADLALAVARRADDPRGVGGPVSGHTGDSDLL